MMRYLTGTIGVSLRLAVRGPAEGTHCSGSFNVTFSPTKGVKLQIHGNGQIDRERRGVLAAAYAIDLARPFRTVSNKHVP